jgi:hypothetical protein
MHKHNEARFNAFIERTDQAIARLDASIARLDASFTKLTEVSAAIGKVVLNREERIKRLEQ